VLVHAGFAIEIVDEQYAAETLELIKDMADLVDDPLFAQEVQY
jgi:hydrogenase expression/formation protein HypC